MRSKPDPVDQPERTAHYDCATCTAEMLHNTIVQRQFCYIPLPPDQHHCSDEAKWRLGGGNLATSAIVSPRTCSGVRCDAIHNSARSSMK